MDHSVSLKGGKAVSDTNANYLKGSEGWDTVY